MNEETVDQMMECYRRLHKEFRFMENAMQLDWPLCTNPKQRHEEFLEYMSKIDDPWATYFYTISTAIETIMWYKEPEDEGV